MDYTNCSKTPKLNFKDICSAVLGFLQMNGQTGKAKRCIFATFHCKHTKTQYIIHSTFCQNQSLENDLHPIFYTKIKTKKCMLSLDKYGNTQIYIISYIVYKSHH
jgi:hypothetical protein